MNKEILQPVRGMRDFYPPDQRRRNRLFRVWQEVAEKFGFEPYDASVVESTNLLRRKAGEEITEQIYCFQDKSGRELSLRPEMTPSMARMVLAKHNSLVYPLKWYFIGQCFRYERMTTGRKREHYQLNLDILGETGSVAEAEVIAAALAILQKFGLTSTEVKVRVGNRQLLVDLLASKGLNRDETQKAFMAIDKRGKISDEEIAKLLAAGGMDNKKIKSIFEILALDSFDQVKVFAGKNSAGVKQLETFFSYARIFGIKDFLEFDISIVRGLSYYTGIVFECFDRDHKFRAIFGGGRYDSLFQNIGGVELSAVGLGFGDVVIGEVLRYYSKELPTDRELDYLVSYTTSNLEARAISLCSALRAQGRAVYLLYGAQRIKKILKFGNQIGAKKVAVLDEREAILGKYLLKDMVTGRQENPDL